MPSLTQFFRRLRYQTRRARHDADLREEMETHRALRQATLEQSGMPAEQAAAASRRSLGNVTLSVEDARDLWGLPVVDRWWQDLKAVFRGLRKNPGFATVTIGTIALAIGANTAFFTIYDSLLLRTLPVREPGSLVVLDGGSWTYPIWQSIDAHGKDVFNGAFAWADQRFDQSGGGPTNFIDGAYVSGHMFDVLGVAPWRGRLLSPADDQRGAGAAAVVISYRLWQRQFGGAEDILGRALLLEHVTFTVVGVMPPEFFGPEVGRSADVMIPFAAEPLIKGNASQLDGRSTWWLDIMGRLKPGGSIAIAQHALQGIQPVVKAETAPEDFSSSMLADYLKDPLTLAPAAVGTSALRGRFEAPLQAMLAIVAVLLLIACANVANLFLARTFTRRHELSVRLALGGSRWRVARLLLAESLVVSSAGALLGLLLAKWGSALLVRQFVTYRSTVSLDLGLDWRVIGFTAGLTVLTAVVAGVLPALGVREVRPAEALRESGRGIAGDRRLLARGALVVTQVALSLVLVTAAGLFLRTFASVADLPLGFNLDHRIVASLNLQNTSLAPSDRLQLAERLRAAAATVPGVQSASLSMITPVTGSGWNGGVGDAVGIPDRDKMTWRNAVSPGWFHTMGIRLLGGRDFDSRDEPGSPHVLVVNETFARKFLTGPPLGQHVRLSGPVAEPEYEVVGVVADAVYRSPRDGHVPTSYEALSQRDGVPAAALTMEVAPGEEASVLRALAQAFATGDANASFTVATFDDYVSAANISERTVAIVSTFTGVLGLLLAGVGLYGVVSQVVSLRQTEIGVRLALGADARRVVLLMLRKAGVWLIVGLTIGGLVSLWASRFIQALLFQVDPRDPLTLMAAMLVLLGAAGAAAAVPARRALRLDPARVLRQD